MYLHINSNVGRINSTIISIEKKSILIVSTNTEEKISFCVLWGGIFNECYNVCKEEQIARISKNKVEKHVSVELLSWQITFHPKVWGRRKFRCWVYIGNWSYIQNRPQSCIVCSGWCKLWKFMKWRLSESLVEAKHDFWPGEMRHGQIS